jgi:hypothetical protein
VSSGTGGTVLPVLPTVSGAAGSAWAEPCAVASLPDLWEQGITCRG